MSTTTTSATDIGRAIDAAGSLYMEEKYGAAYMSAISDLKVVLNCMPESHAKRVRMETYTVFGERWSRPHFMGDFLYENSDSVDKEHYAIARRVIHRIGMEGVAAFKVKEQQDAVKEHAPLPKDISAVVAGYL